MEIRQSVGARLPISAIKNPRPSVRPRQPNPTSQNLSQRLPARLPSTPIPSRTMMRISHAHHCPNSRSRTSV